VHTQNKNMTNKMSATDLMPWEFV